MKKISIIAIMGALFVGAANAGFVEVAEVVQPASDHSATVQSNSTPIILEGAIIQHLNGNKYLFSDPTGSITVEIDDADWRGQTVSPSDKVRIYGEIDSESNGTEIDVTYLEKL